VGKESSFEELEGKISRCAGSVLYTPAKSETDYNDPSFPFKIPRDRILIPTDKDSNPFEWATRCIHKFKNDSVCVFVPGTRFDRYGTRHGRGVGWYDRFFSKIPPHWLRIGVIDSKQLQHTRLMRQEWDEAVDWIIVWNDFSWSTYKAPSRL